MICQATVAEDGIDAWDSCAGWCNEDAVTTVPLTLVSQERLANVWLCQAHLDEFLRKMEAA